MIVLVASRGPYVATGTGRATIELVINLKAAKALGLAALMCAGCCRKHTSASRLRSFLHCAAVEPQGAIQATAAARTAVDCQIPNSLGPHIRAAILRRKSTITCKFALRRVRSSADLQNDVPSHGSTRW